MITTPSSPTFAAPATNASSAFATPVGESGLQADSPSLMAFDQDLRGPTPPRRGARSTAVRVSRFCSGAVGWACAGLAMNATDGQWDSNVD
jgi:hypothetical protein